MLVKLYDVGLSGRKWLFLNNWYEDLTSQVNWKGEVSSSYNETLSVCDRAELGLQQDIISS